MHLLPARPSLAAARMPPRLRRHLVSLVLAVLLPLAAGGGLAVAEALRASRQGFESRLLDTARAMAFLMDAEVQRIRPALEALAEGATTDPAGEADFADLYRRSLRFAAHLGVTIAARSADPARTLRLTTDLPYESVPSFPASPAFEAASLAAERDGRTALTDLDTSRPGRPPLAFLITPLGPAEARLGTIGAAVDPVRLSERLAAQGLANGTAAALVDSTGRVVARSAEPARFVGQQVPGWSMRLADDQASGLLTAPNLLGHSAVIAIVRLPNWPGWTVAVSTTERAYRASWQDPLLMLAGTGLLAAVSALGGAWLMSWRLLRPLAVLAGRAAGIAAGTDPDHRPSAPARGALRVAEFEALEEAFDAASDALRRQALDARQERELLRSVLDGTADAVFVKDLDGRYILANAAAARSMGRPAEAVVGLTDAELWPALAASLAEADRKVLRDEETITEEEIWPDAAGGQQRIFLTTRTPWREPVSGAALGVIGVAHDVTDSARAKETLRVALEAGRLGTWSWEVGAGDGRVDWDARCRALHGVAEGGRVDYAAWTALLPREDLRAAEAAIARTLDPADPRDDYHAEYRVRHPGGSILRLSTCGRAIFEADPAAPAGRRATRLVGTVRDVTRLREIQAHQTFLVRLTDTLRSIADASAMQEAACGLLGRELRVSRVGIAHMDTTGDTMTVRRDWCDGTAPSVVGTWRADDFGPARAGALKRGETIAIADVVLDPRTAAPEVTAAYGDIGTRAILAVPLMRDDRQVALLFLHHHAPRPWSPAEVALARATCERLWEAAERATAEADTAASEARFRALVEASAEVFWACDPEGFAREDLPTWRAFTGQAHAEMLGFGWQEMVHPDDRERVLAQWQGCVTEGRDYAAEYRLRHKDGGYRWMAFRGRRLLDADGTLTGWVGMATDITPRHEAEERLRAGAARLRLTLDAAELGTWDLDLGAGQVHLDARAQAHFGGALRSAALAELVARIHPDDRPILRRVAAAAEDPARRAPIDTRYRTIGPDGTLRWLSVFGAVQFDGSGPDATALRVVGTTQDITERVRTGERLRATERDLQQLARRSTIAAMASGIAHELNQPLGAATNYLSGAARLLDAGDIPDPGGTRRWQAAWALDRAGSQVLRAGAVLRRLREFLGSGETHRSAEPVAEVVREAVGLVLDASPDASLAPLDFEADPAAGAARMDRVQVQQVVVNLVRNAVEAMAENAAGTARRLSVRVGATGPDAVEVSVADTGPGLPEHVAATLFETFRSTKAGGMGVGLSICRTIVEGHGGRIAARPALGGGTVFTFTLARDGGLAPAGEQPELAA